MSSPIDEAQDVVSRMGVNGREEEFPLLSVIVPVYNVEPYLRRCMDSLCCQAYPNMEIICVDDGSTDDSLAVLRQYEVKDCRVRVVTRPNRGLSAARNTGLELASGEWVSFVDSDDYLLPHACTTAMACVSGSVDMVHFGARVEADESFEDMTTLEGTQQWVDVPYAGVRKVDAGYFSSTAWNVWSKLYRRSLIEKHNLRFDEQNYGSEDLCFHVRYCFLAKAVFCCPELLYAYVLRGSSISFNSLNAEKIGRFLRSLLHVVENMCSAYTACGCQAAHEPYLSYVFRVIVKRVVKAPVGTDGVCLWLKKLIELARQCGLQNCAGTLEQMQHLEVVLPRMEDAAVLVGRLQTTLHAASRMDEEGVFHLALFADARHGGKVLRLIERLKQSAACQQAVCVHVFCDGVSAAFSAGLKELEGEQVSILLHEVDSRLLHVLPSLEVGISRAAFLKMLMPRLLPTCARVLVVEPGVWGAEECLATYGVDMKGRAVAAVLRTTPSGNEVFDSSLLLMDLNLLREQGACDWWLVTCMYEGGLFPCAERDSFNIAFRYAIEPLVLQGQALSCALVRRKRVWAACRYDGLRLRYHLLRVFVHLCRGSLRRRAEIRLARCIRTLSLVTPFYK